MALEFIQPDGLPTPESYTHAVVATGTTTVYVAGQVAEDADGNLVAPGDFAAQAKQAFANVGLVIAAAGARPDQVARLTIYIVGHRPELLPAVSAARVAVFGDHKPADTILGVQTLAEAGRLIEVEAIAVLD